MNRAGSHHRSSANRRNSFRKLLEIRQFSRNPTKCHELTGRRAVLSVTATISPNLTFEL